MDSPFIELGVVIIAAGLFGVLARFLRQPPLVGYVIAGFLLGPLGYHLIQNQNLLGFFSDLGIAFLLFLVGLELNFNTLKSLGWRTLNLALIQVVLTFGLGYAIGLLLNYNPITAAVIGLSIAFSSTIVVLKLISEKNDIQSLYGKIAVAILIFQDIVAVVALALVTSTGGGASLSTEIINLVAKIVLLFVIAIVMSKLVLPKVWRWLANSRDLLFLASLSWCFLFAIIAHWFGFSFAIGAFLAGLSLAAIPYNLDIVGQVRPLRDFFIVLFFVLIGFNITPSGAIDWQLVAVLLSLALIAKPFIILSSLSAQHFKLRTSFFAAGSLGQLSEFSVILAMAAATSGLVSSTVVSSIVVATAFSLGLSSYFITAADTLFSWFKPLLKPLEPTQINHQSLESTPELFNHVVVFGYHRMGWHILKMLRKLKKEVLIVDFNPEVIERLRNKGVAAVFGDATDPELLETVHLKNAEMIISTIPYRQENLMLVESIRRVHKDILTIATASEIDDALELYQKGADYVILPQMLGGEYIAELLEKYQSGTLRRFLTGRKNEAKLTRTRNHSLYY